MCLRLRNTANRGRSAVPVIRLRSRSCRATRRSFLLLTDISQNPLFLRCGAFTRLQLDRFALVSDALTLVWLWLADLANVGRDLADEGFIDASDFDLLRSRSLFGCDLERDAINRIHIYGMRVAHVEEQSSPLSLNAIPDADDFQRFGVAGSYADNHVVDERSSQPMLAARLAQIIRPLQHNRSLLVL